MLINKTYFIDSCDDVELNIKRESKLEYRITYDDEKEMKAVVFVIGGYGANANIHFLDSYRKFIAKKFDVVTINVFYHCFCQRKSDVERYSAEMTFLLDDIRKFEKAFKDFEIDFEILDNTINIEKYYQILDKKLTLLKDNKLLETNYKIDLSCTFVPPNNEYQNFGIMAAIDHINALKDILNKYPQFNTLPKIYGGGSYGGYLALMCAKIAPWYVDGVIDNSGAALPPLKYIIGRDLNEGDAILNHDELNSRVYCYVETYWQRKNPNSPYYFADENYLIRALLNQTHLILQAQKNKDIVYISYHSKKDPATPADYKISMVEILKALNYEVDFHLIEEKDIDGKYIKDLEHGCGISDKALFNKELPNMLEKLKGKEFNIRENSISYPCKDKVFTFKDKDDKFVLELN
ncbi:DUF2920 family protein [Campylobacter insulaenigrae]|uniref:DUF2920 domain protein n=3 Tax=Campylobacter insulaenigrae TaxID=260714 RepID=A0A0A8H4A1_9BACT|nr:DUF2920 family protein [Campylobacter insulaenigrae]AJC87739.1 hypothetical protein (DUF2920 domain) [Campylobacter insulaenigrae NCTC 12927]VEH94015.1 Protein of uncharacterised function (DUF2920) [Campylobacter insulaenigrae]